MLKGMLLLIFGFFLLSHPLNFFSSSDAPSTTENFESGEGEEEEEEDICYIPILDREEDDS